MRSFYKLCVALSCSAIAFGCGGNGASNNDQGVAITFLGLFSSLPNQSAGSGGGSTGGGSGGCIQLPQGISGGYINLTYDPAATPTPDEGNLSADASGGVGAPMGLQNNMYGQFYRADRVDLEYFIPGSMVQPPSASGAINLLAGPLEAAQTTGPSSGSSSGTGLRKPVVSSLPPTFSQICNRAFAEIYIIPVSIADWIKFNKNQLPPAPFDMEIIVKVSGLSSSGNRYETNAGAFIFGIDPGSGKAASSADVSTESVDDPQPATEAREEGGESDQGEDGLADLEDAFDTESVTEG